MNGTTEQILFSITLALVAMAYATVGQGGATGYIAIMGLVGFAPDVIRPAALILNVFIGTGQFARAGLLKWRTFYPFACWASLVQSSAVRRICRRMSLILSSADSCYWPHGGSGDRYTPKMLMTMRTLRPLRLRSWRVR